MNYPVHTHPVIPSQRAPIPYLAGSYHEDYTTTNQLSYPKDGISFGSPKVGTAWNLEAISVTLALIGATTTPNYFMKFGFDLLLDNQPIGSVSFYWSDGGVPEFPAGGPPITVPITDSIQFTNPVPIFDTSQLTIKNNGNTASSNAGFTGGLTMSWRGQVSYR